MKVKIQEEVEAATDMDWRLLRRMREMYRDDIVEDSPWHWVA